MKKVVYLLAVLFTMQLSAQQLKIKKSPVYQDNKKISELAMMVDDKQGGVFAIRPYFSSMLGQKGVKLGYYIEHYNTDLKLLKSHTYKIVKNRELAGAFVNDNQFYYVEYVKDRKAKRINVVANYTAIDAMKFKQKKLFTIPSKNINSFYHDLLADSYKSSKLLANVSFSNDANYGLFYFDMYNRKEDTYRLYVLNNKMELAWSKQLRFPYKDRNFRIEDIQVSNDGTAYMLAKVYQGGFFSRAYHYELYKINKDGLLKKMNFSEPNYYVTSLKIINDKLDDTINIVGFYSQYYTNNSYVSSYSNDVSYNVKNYRVRGVCTYQIATDSLEITTKNFQKFSSQFIQDKYGKVRKDRSGRTKNIDIGNVVMRDVFFATNGDLIVTAEEVEMHVQQEPQQYYGTGGYNSGFSNTQNTNTYSYVFGDAMVFRLNKEGELIWSRNINKHFASRSLYDPLISFSVTASDEKVFVFLTANKKLGKMTKGRKRFKEGFSGVTKYNSKMYAIQFDNMGQWTAKALVDNKQSDVIYYSKLGYRMPNKEIYFFGRFRKNKQLMRISF